MSKLDELIKEYCRGGVEHKPLKDVCDIKRGKRLTKSVLLESGKYEVYHGSTTSILGYYNDFNVTEDTVIVVNTGGIGGVKYIDKCFWCSDGCFYLKGNETINNKFLYYFLSQYTDYFIHNIRVGGVPTIDRLCVEILQIPIPPLPVQEEIVRILDTFSELEAELEAELQLRKKQFEFYRNQILSFNYMVAASAKCQVPSAKCQVPSAKCQVPSAKCQVPTPPLSTIKYLPLGEICRIRTGRLNANAKNNNGIYPFFTCDKNPYRINTYSFDTDAILISGNGSQVGHINRYEGKFDVYQRTYVLDCFNEVDKNYLYYYLNNFLKPYILQNSLKASIPYITLPMLQNFKIAVPPLEYQKEIINTLDNFEKLVNNIMIGLPAEIQSRRKQYEYYRNKLLSFA